MAIDVRHMTYFTPHTSVVLAIYGSAILNTIRVGVIRRQFGADYWSLPNYRHASDLLHDSYLLRQ